MQKKLRLNELCELKWNAKNDDMRVFLCYY